MQVKCKADFLCMCVEPADELMGWNYWLSWTLISFPLAFFLKHLASSFCKLELQPKCEVNRKCNEAHLHEHGNQSTKSGQTFHEMQKIKNRRLHE